MSDAQHTGAPAGGGRRRAAWVALAIASLTAAAGALLAGPMGAERDALLIAQARLALSEVARAQVGLRDQTGAFHPCDGLACAPLLGLPPEDLDRVDYRLSVQRTPEGALALATPTRPGLPELRLPLPPAGPAWDTSFSLDTPQPPR